MVQECAPLAIYLSSWGRHGGQRTGARAAAWLLPDGWVLTEADLRELDDILADAGAGGRDRFAQPFDVGAPQDRCGLPSTGARPQQFCSTRGFGDLPMVIPRVNIVGERSKPGRLHGSLRFHSVEGSMYALLLSWDLAGTQNSILSEVSRHISDGPAAAAVLWTA